MSGPSLFPEIPLEIRACRIGSCMNSLTRSLMPYAVTFDPHKLLGTGLLRFIKGTGELACQANASSSATAESSFFGLAAQAKASFFGCTASAGFNMDLASKSTTSSQGINCFVSYTYKGQCIRLLYQGMSPQTLYGYMTEDFQKYYDAVMNARTVAGYLAAYDKFTQKYGHGCVTALHLTAGSAFRIEIKSNSAAQANSQKYGASLAVNTPAGGASAAVSWGQEVSLATAGASMSLIGQDLPEDAPTSAWCREMVAKFADKGIDILANKAETISTPTNPSPTPPSLPDLPKKELGRKTKPAPKVTKADLPQKVREALMKEDGYASWEKYVEDQKKAYEDLTAKNIVDEARKIGDNAAKAKSEAPAEAGAARAPVPDAARTSKRAAAEPNSDIWSLGGYVPYAYEVTPWSELFPDLLLKLPTGFSSVYLARIYTFYLTRLQFGQYLSFLSDVGPELCENAGIQADVDIYAACCDKLRESIAESPPVRDDQYTRLVEGFESQVHDFRFHSQAAYDAFFTLYEALSASPYGLIPVQADNGKYETGDMKAVVLPVPFSITPMLRDALRYYPVLTPHTLQDKRLKLAYFHNGWRSATTLALDLPLSLEKDEQGYPYLARTILPVFTPATSYPCSSYPAYVELFLVGFGDVPVSTKDAYVRGLPTFDALPFEEIRELARPPSAAER